MAEWVGVGGTANSKRPFFIMSKIDYSTLCPQPKKVEPGTKQIEIVSLGCGVQSSTMVLMAAAGQIKPMPDAAIFADVGWEPDEVYQYLEYLKPRLPFPIYVVSNGNIREDMLAASKGQTRSANPPFYTKAVSGKGEALLRRKCTEFYKIRPLVSKIRELLGFKKGERVKKARAISWIGISTDEMTRMKESQIAWNDHRWPLIEKGMSRQGCLDWMEQNGHPPPPRSACIGCPYHHNKVWREMKNNQPHYFEDAVDFDKGIREGFGGSQSQCFVHRSLQPLDEVDFRNDVDFGQMTMLDECEGMCGN